MDDEFDFRAPRLHLDAPLAAGDSIPVSPDQANYLLNVLRLGDGGRVLVFNGRDGEWLANVTRVGKRGAALAVERQTKPQSAGPDIDYWFAPLKRSRLDYMVQKATELGVARLKPVITHRTIAERVNLERMRANVIEAAEQCGILRVPEILPPEPLEKALAAIEAGRALIFCDEGATVANPIAALAEAKSGPITVLIGPEGGFDASERERLLTHANVIRLSLGPRIMRADTAAVAALSLVNATLGDWT